MALTIMPSWSDNYQASDNNEEAILALLKEQSDLFLLINTYQPKLKTNLIQKKLDGVSYWTAFDALQRVTLKDKKPLQIDQLTWPSGATFIRLFDRIGVLVDNQLYANIFFTYPKGDQIDRIDLMKKGELDQQLTIDDRGFVSRVVIYENAQPKEIHYLSQGGFVVAKENFVSGVVSALLPDGQEKTYATMDSLINELTLAYLHANQESTMLVFDSDKNWQLIQQADNLSVAYWLADTDLPEAKKEQLLAMQNVTVLSSQDDGVVDTLLSPYAVKKGSVAQAKDQELIYVKLGDLTAPAQQELLQEAFELAIQSDNRTFIFEGQNSTIALSPSLEKMVAERGAAFDWPENQEAVLKARFIFLEVQPDGERAKYLATSSLYCDLSKEPSLEGLAQATAFALPVLTTEKNYYQQEVFLKQEEGQRFSDGLLSLLERAEDPDFKQELQDKRSDFDEESLQAAWAKALHLGQ